MLTCVRKDEEKAAREMGSATSKSAAPPRKAVESELAGAQGGVHGEHPGVAAIRGAEIFGGRMRARSRTDSVTDLSRSAEDAPIIRMANSILALAIKKGASDIHVEPQEKDLNVRFRIDGELQVVQVLPKKVQMGLISRFKIARQA